MTEKRFDIETNERFEVSIKDNLTKKYPFSVSCESVDDYENIIDEAMSVGVLLNQLWEQTQRFEKHNKDLEKKYHELMEYKQYVLNYVKEHYDYAHEQRQKNLDNIFVANAYGIIKYDMGKLLEELNGGDVE